MKTSKYLLLILVTLSLSSCKFFKDNKLFTNDVDSLVAETPEPIEAPPPVVEEPEPVIETPPPPVEGDYYMIVGCFLNEKYAQEYAQGVNAKGYQAKIVYSSSSGYYKVAAKSYLDYATGVSEIEQFRNEFPGNVWLYKKK